MTAQVCGKVSSGYTYACTREQGHDGAHIATDGNGRVLDTWYPNAVEKPQ